MLGLRRVRFDYWMLVMGEGASLLRARLRPPSKRRRKIREAVFSRDGFACFYCEVPVTHYLDRHCSGESLPPDAATLDHIETVAEGGRFTVDNLVTACRYCNNRRGNQPAADFLAMIRAEMASR